MTEQGGRMSTAPMPVGDRFPYFREEIGARFGLGEITTPIEAGFRAEVGATSIAGLVVADVATDPIVLRRTRRDIALHDRDMFTLGLLLEGTAVVSQGGREVALQPLDLVLCDSRRPFRIRFDGPQRQLLVDIPVTELAGRLPSAEAMTATRIDGRTNAAPLARAVLAAACGRAAGSADSETAAAERMLDLVAIALARGASPAPVEWQWTRRIEAYVEAHLADPDLGPDRIARAFRISRRYLFGIFEHERLTLGNLILSRRLEHCRAALADVAQADRSVSDIAFAWGFTNASHFSHAFRDAFGVAPSDSRRG